jgi:hypothetical protein
VNAAVAGRPVTLTSATGTNVAVTCTTGSALTDSFGVASFACTVGQLTASVVGQAPLTAKVVFNANVAPVNGGTVNALAPLEVPVLGALCGGLSGTGSTTYFEGFEATTTSMTGSYQAFAGSAAFAAFHGEFVRVICAPCSMRHGGMLPSALHAIFSAACLLTSYLLQ